MSENRIDFLSLLPPELAFHILSFIRPEKLSVISGASVQWRQLANDNQPWLPYICATIPNIVTTNAKWSYILFDYMRFLVTKERQLRQVELRRQRPSIRYFRENYSKEDIEIAESEPYYPYIKLGLLASDTPRLRRLYRGKLLRLLWLNKGYIELFENLLHSCLLSPQSELQKIGRWCLFIAATAITKVDVGYYLQSDIARAYPCEAMLYQVAKSVLKWMLASNEQDELVSGMALIRYILQKDAGTAGSYFCRDVIIDQLFNASESQKSSALKVIYDAIERKDKKLLYIAVPEIYYKVLRLIDCGKPSNVDVQKILRDCYTNNRDIFCSIMSLIIGHYLYLSNFTKCMKQFDCDRSMSALFNMVLESNDVALIWDILPQCDHVNPPDPEEWRRQIVIKDGFTRAEMNLACRLFRYILQAHFAPKTRSSFFFKPYSDERFATDILKTLLTTELTVNWGIMGYWSRSDLRNMVAEYESESASEHVARKAQ